MEEARQPLGDGGQARAEVAEARLLYALFDRLPAMIAYWDRDLRNVVANHAYIEWFGFTPEQMRGIHIREVLGEEVYAKNRPHMLAALAGQEQLFDRTLVDTFGRTRHTQASYVPDIVGGEVRGFFVLVTDVTPRVEAQRAMEEAQSLAKLGSWTWTLKTDEITWSKELFRIFGESRDFVPTMESLMTRVHPDDVAQMKAVRERASREGREYSSDFRIYRTDGAVREVHSRGRPVVDDTGAVVRMTGTVQDVTEANEAAREMARINAELRQVNQLNADVLGMLGHDVRSPLTVILGYLEGLDEDWADSSEEERREQIAIVRSSAAKLRALVDDILALATLDAGKLVPRLDDHDLGALVREALEDVPGAGALELYDDGGVRVRCDAFHVRQVVANLAANAVRHGAAPMTIAVSTQDGRARVVVTDQGPGVPEDFVPRLFERFSRRSGQLTESSGFGLYIACRLAEANRGSLTYRPGPDGRGASFVLTLPRAS